MSTQKEARSFEKMLRGLYPAMIWAALGIAAAPGFALKNRNPQKISRQEEHVWNNKSQVKYIAQKSRIPEPFAALLRRG